MLKEQELADQDAEAIGQDGKARADAGAGLTPCQQSSRQCCTSEDPWHF